jgi:hypothetical protein
MLLSTSLYKNSLYILLILITLAFFLKTGLTPFHLYKIELYKGMPFVSIFFYNTFYFLFYFLFFIIFIIFYLNELYLIYVNITNYLVYMMVAYIIVFMFNLNYVKVFFAYSTIINSIMFILLAFIILI